MAESELMYALGCPAVGGAIWTKRACAVGRPAPPIADIGERGAAIRPRPKALDGGAANMEDYAMAAEVDGRRIEEAAGEDSGALGAVEGAAAHAAEPAKAAEMAAELGRADEAAEEEGRVVALAAAKHGRLRGYDSLLSSQGELQTHARRPGVAPDGQIVSPAAGVVS